MATTAVNDILPSGLQLPPQFFDDGLPAWHAYGSQLLNQGAALYDQISSKFNHVMTSIDQNQFEGHEREMLRYCIATTPVTHPSPEPLPRGPPSPPSTKKSGKKEKKAITGSSNAISISYLSKVDYYANSKLPLNLEPLRLTIKTWPLISLAATYSERVYESPRGPERSTHVDADWKTGAKAMTIKSVANTTFKAIVFAIRGTSSFMDWVVNLNTAPTSPNGFLDDAGNLCHAGFLSVARRMIAPVATRLKQLLEEDPRRAKYSLIITGHSAGGAVASLLFSHILSTSSHVRSELKDLVDSQAFRRVHCITFGTPPVTLLPLQKPERNPKLANWLFMTFVNEGDPVARADREYVKSLLELFATPNPSSCMLGDLRSLSMPVTKSEKRKTLASSKSSKALVTKHKKNSSGNGISSGSPTRGGTKKATANHELQVQPTWPVPPCTLSLPGSIYVLRSGELFKNCRGSSRVNFPQAPSMRKDGKKTVEERVDEGVVAQKASDEQLRPMIWGDPVCHVMKLYTLRIETLAIGAVTWGSH